MQGVDSNFGPNQINHISTSDPGAPGSGGSPEVLGRIFACIIAIFMLRLEVPRNIQAQFCAAHCFVQEVAYEIAIIQKKKIVHMQEVHNFHVEDFFI